MTPCCPCRGCAPATQLSEVRAAGLGFRVAEAATSLGAGMGLRLEREQLAGLVESLTERELEVLRLLAARRCNAGIAAELFVDQSTVKTHLVYLYSKLAVHSRTQAAARAPRLLTDPGRGFHPASPPSGGRAPPSTPPS